MTRTETLAMLKTEVQRKGWEIPSRWNTELVTAMLGSTSGALIVYGTICRLGLGVATEGSLIREAVAKASWRHRKRQRAECLTMFGRRPADRRQLRRWYRLARLEGNDGAGGDCRVERDTFALGRVVGTFDLMDNGDNVARLRCECGADETRRWRAVDMPLESPTAIADMIERWHRDCDVDLMDVEVLTGSE